VIDKNDIIDTLSRIKNRTGMFFQPQNSYDVAVAFTEGFLLGAYLGCVNSLQDRNVWCTQKLGITDCSCGVAYVVKMKNPKLSETELIQEYLDVIIEYYKS